MEENLGSYVFVVTRKAHKRILLNIQDIVRAIDNRVESKERDERNNHMQIQRLIDQMTIRTSGSRVTELDEGDPQTSSMSSSSPGECKASNPSHSEGIISESDIHAAPVRINASLASPANKCDTFCSCQCHIRREGQTPRWLHFMFGTLFYSSTVLPLASPQACNVLSCHRSGVGSTRLSYFFPSWAFARVVYISKTWRSLNAGDATWTLKMPRMVADDAPVWHKLKMRDTLGIKGLFNAGQASPYDVDKMGSSVLHVSVDLR